MLGSLAKQDWYRLAPLLLLQGCLVSFNDYPLEATSGPASASGSASGGSSAGGGGSAGGGNGGSVSAAPATMIDDFEDGDSGIIEHEGRIGGWYADNDGQGMQTPSANSSLVPSTINPPRAGSARGAHTFGGPFGAWGALIGTALADEEPYDLSDYQGVRFWVRLGSSSPFLVRQVRVNLPSSQTNEGGGCTVCNDHFGADIPLTSQWARIEVRFAELQQAGFGAPELNELDVARVTAIQFIFTQGVSFDLWVDDVELF